MEKSLREYWNRHWIPAISGERGDSMPSKWKTLKESSAEILCDEMESLYWDAVTREMMNAVRTLHGWFNENKEATAAFLNLNQDDMDSFEVARNFLEQVTSPGEALRSIYGRLFDESGPRGNANRLAKKKASEQDPNSLNEATKISATVHDHHISSIIEMLSEHHRKSKCDINSGLALYSFEIDITSLPGANHVQARLILQGMGMFAAQRDNTFSEHCADISSRSPGHR